MIHIGIGCNIFLLDYELYGDLLPHTWVKNVWAFASKYDITLPSTTSVLDLHRQGDVFLMEEFANSGFSMTDLKKLNRCRLYLQVHALSDISNSYGSNFDKRCYDGHHAEFRTSVHPWPTQHRPGPSEWRL